MLYHYVASDKAGKILEGDMDAGNLEGVLQFLAGKELSPVNVIPLKQERGGVRRLFGNITITDKIFLVKYLSLMLRVGTDLLSAVNILLADFDKPAMKNFLLEVRDNLSKGQQFYKVFEKYPAVFSPTFVNLIKAAETSGNLQRTFEELSKSLGREAEIRGKVRSAMIYPLILISAASAITIFLVTFALPKIAKVFTETGLNPPTFSRIVFAVGLFIGDHLAVILISAATLIGFGIYFFTKNLVGRHMISRFLSRAPLVRKVYRELAIESFASTTSSLLRAGLPIVETMNVAADTVGSEEYRLALRRITKEGLEKGLTIGEAFRRETVFPKVVVNLIAISEKAGHLDEVLATLSDFYAADIDTTIKNIVGLLEPLLLIGMGVLVATIALSIIIPIYQLTASF